MTITIPWVFIKAQGRIKEANYKGTTIKLAMARIEEYWNVKLPQVNNVAQSQIRIYYHPGVPKTKGAAMWVTGNTINVKSDYKWGIEAQMVLTMVHEVLHVLGGGNHIEVPGHVMSAIIGDPYINFTARDAAYMRRYAWKSPTRRPWNEPRFWYPAPRSTIAQFFLGKRKMPESYPTITMC